jgi:hypothetical protein
MQSPCSQGYAAAVFRPAILSLQRMKASIMLQPYPSIRWWNHLIVTELQSQKEEWWLLQKVYNPHASVVVQANVVTAIQSPSGRHLTLIPCNCKINETIDTQLFTLFPFSAFQSLFVPLVLWWPDLGSSMRIGLPPYLVWWLQSVQNAAARLIFCFCGNDHIVDAFLSLL